MQKFLIIGLILFSTLNCVDAQKQNEKIQQYVKELADAGFNGSVLVSHKGKILVEEGIGYADIGKQQKNTSKTIFTTGSITKQFTGAAILKLEMMGKLKVTDFMYKYVEGVPEDKRGITLHHLLTHSAGLPGGLGRDDVLISTPDFLQEAMDAGLRSAPGEKYSYSNVGYALLGIIIENVTGESYESFLQKHLFQPAGMKNTGYVMANLPRDNMAKGFNKSGESWGYLTDKNWGKEGPGWHLKGNGGILSTIEDLYKWHIALKGEKILTQSAKKKYYTKHIEEGQGAGTYYGYGWAIFPTSRGTDLITHNGGNGIFFADFLRYLEEDVVAIMMSNQATRQFENVAFELARTLVIDDYTPSVKDVSAGGMDEEAAEQLLMKFMDVIREDNESMWQKYLTTHATQDFISMADMDFHMEQFKKMHASIGTQEIVGGDIDGTSVSLKLDGGSKLMMEFVTMGDGQLKIAGIMAE